MSALTIDAIRDCLEGAVPSIIATVAADGTPNVTYVSQVDYVDPQHVALSFQFFNKTRANILANPHATVAVIHPESAAAYQVALRYLRTESEGPLFQRMKAKLAGIASHTGMADVFKLRGADVYRVERIDAIPGRTMSVTGPRRNLLSALRSATARLNACVDLAALVDETLLALEDYFGVHHAMVLMFDDDTRRLYTVASRGYPSSGIGSEIALGDGVIGVAAEHRAPIRIAHMTSEYAYGRIQREGVTLAGLGDQLQREIPFPGLPEAHSQLAVPILSAGRLAGALYVESPEDRRFGYDDEDALVALAAQLGTSMQLLRQTEDADEAAREADPAPPTTGGDTVTVRRYCADDSVFLGEDYLIKGVAGAILWKLLGDHARDGRTDFTNRELRLDASLRLPDVADNLEARLILLARRLDERCDFLRIEKTGRGRFRLKVGRPLRLVETPRA
jgi:adenylate cyclase